MKNEKRKAKNEQGVMNNRKRAANKGRGVTFLALLFAICYLFFGCPDPFEPPPDGVTTPAGYGRVAVTVSAAQGRTIFPTMEFAHYEYEFAKVTNGTTGDWEAQVPAGGFFTLELGDWKVKVRAFADAGDSDPAAAGVSDTFTLSGGEAEQVTVQLAGSIEDGEGSFSYHIEYPSGAEITVFKLENLLAQAAVIDITPGAGSASPLEGTCDIPAGVYYLTIMLVDGHLSTGANEVVYVYDKLDSAYNAVFTEDNFIGTYTVTFDSDGGDYTPADQTVFEGRQAYKPIDDPTKTGWILDHWFNTATNAEWEFSTPITASLNLKAKWVLDLSMVFVEGGAFVLGREVGGVPAPAGITTLPTTTPNVTLSDFYIGRYEVTGAQWKAVMGSMPSGMTAPPGLDANNYPVAYVNSLDMMVFCNRLSIAEGLTPAYRIAKSINPNEYSTNPDDWGTPPSSFYQNDRWRDAAIVGLSSGYRLPTEAQWEYAAKGGNPDADGWVGYTWAGSDVANDVAWFFNNISPTNIINEVGQLAPNRLGIFDMSGNIAEICWDWYASDHTSGDKIDPTGPDTWSNTQYLRVARGHYEGTPPNVRMDARSVARSNTTGINRTALYGFRIARPAAVEGVGDITATTWRDGSAVSLFAPAPAIATPAGQTITAQGWQISDTGTSGWSNLTVPTAEMSHNGKNLRYHAEFSGGKTYYSNTVLITVISPVNSIAAPFWRDGNAISLTAPAVFGTPSAQGWEISDDGSSGWASFTATTADMSYHGKYLRYYATLGGETYYSPNTVTIAVGLALDEVTIDMYDSANDGWDGSGALRIVKNGTELATGVKVGAAVDNTPSGQRGTNTYTFSVATGDVVQLYWVAGSSQGENSFIAYYSDVPPSPAFTSSNNNSWNGSNALVFRLRGGMTSIAGGTLLGEFTVP